MLSGAAGYYARLWQTIRPRRFLTARAAPTDQGSQFTSDEFTGTLLDANIRISMDGKGRALDNIFRGRPCGGTAMANSQIREYLPEIVCRWLGVGDRLNRVFRLLQPSAFSSIPAVSNTGRSTKGDKKECLKSSKKSNQLTTAQAALFVIQQSGPA